jgi:hypothetical protein
MKPQRSQRNTLCPQKDFPLKEISEKIIPCALEVHSTLENIPKHIYRASDKRVGLLTNLNAARLREGIKRLIIQRTQRGGNNNFFNSLKIDNFSGSSVVRF